MRPMVRRIAGESEGGGGERLFFSTPRLLDSSTHASLQGKRVTLMGLGTRGGGSGVARYLARAGSGRYRHRRQAGGGAGRAAGGAGRAADPVRPRRARRGGFHAGRRGRDRPQPGCAATGAAAGAGAASRVAGRDGDDALLPGLPGPDRRRHRDEGQDDRRHALRRDAAGLAAVDRPGRQHGRLRPRPTRPDHARNAGRDRGFQLAAGGVAGASASRPGSLS